MELWAAFILGLFGSLHCVGMCGPIVMALPLTAREKGQVVFQATLYHLGRIFTYALMGLFMGLLGWGIGLAGYQKAFSIILGAGLIVMAVFSVSIERRMMQTSLFQRIFEQVKKKLSGALSINSRSSAFRIGMLNGILPCGLVYVALAGAVTSLTATNGAVYMAAFGFGTLPMMLGVMVFGNLFRKHLLRFRKLIPIGLVLFGALLIYRGVVLEVPFDLKFWEDTNFQPMCH